jgi:NAD(P)H dehydrogenase (quinone)
MYAITAATGQLGRLTVNNLKRHLPENQIVAIVRDPGKAADLGIPVRQGDYNDRQGMTNALRGVERLLLISGSDISNRASQHANVVEAAKAAGVKAIAYTSLLNAGLWKVPGFEAHMLTEETIRRSGLSFTFLRNGWYAENNLPALAPALAHGRLFGASRQGRISWAARSDYAEAAALVLASEGHLGKTYELAGDSAHSFADLAAMASKACGRPLAYEDVSEDQYAEILAFHGLPQPFAKLIAAVDAHAIARGILEDSSGTLSKLIGHPTTPVEASVRDHLKNAMR